MVLAVLILGLEETGLYHPDPPNPDYGWPVLAFYAGLMLIFAGLAFRAWRRRIRGNPRRPSNPWGNEFCVLPPEFPSY